jgi:hypothetical protein
MLRLRTWPFFPLLLTAASIGAGCNSTDTQEVVRDPARADAALTAGLQLWQQTAQKQGDTYFYWRVRPAGATGIREVTGVQVRRGSVVLRLISRGRQRDDGGVDMIEGLHESLEQSRSPGTGRRGAFAGGFPARTLPELYDDCASAAALSGKADGARAGAPAEFGLQIDRLGVLRQCYTVAANCQGDCVRSFGVDGLVFQELDRSAVQKFLTTTTPDLD